MRSFSTPRYAAASLGAALLVAHSAVSAGQDTARGSVSADPAVAGGTAGITRYPINAFVHEPVLSGLSVSPNGKHLAGISLPAMNAVPQVTIWSADDLSKPPLRFDLVASNGSRWKPQGVNWLNDERLLASGGQTLDANFGGRMIKTFNSNTFVYELNSLDEPGRNRLREPFENLYSGRSPIRGVGIARRLPNDPSRVILSIRNADGGSDLHDFNLKDYSNRRVYRGIPGESLSTDWDGEASLRSASMTVDGDAGLSFRVRVKGTDEWKQLPRLVAKAREGAEPIGVAKDPDIVYVRDNTGREFSAIREYRLSTGTMSEPIFAHPRYDAAGIIFGHGARAGELLGFRFEGLYQGSDYWLDEDLARLQASLDKTFPGKQVLMRIGEGLSSADGRRFIVVVRGSNDPGSYYLYDFGKGLLPLGSIRPLLDPTQLAETRFVTYKARDGLAIPAYLTVPKGGAKPHPTVILPHGGPWARDDMGFDPWVQFLANRGYAVLQPQYRGSLGWGQKLWRAGDREWGQKMQDDKDDGAAWLVQQGTADKDRIAMYGFSYGGYAAMAAIVRPNPPYQCAIAGAGLSELRTFDKVTFGSRFGREFQNPTVAGLSPLDEVQKASIPIMIFHGDRDQTVPIDQSEKYHNALKAAGKNTQYVEIKDYGHGPSLSAVQQAKVLEILETYLANDCGPGGL